MSRSGRIVTGGGRGSLGSGTRIAALNVNFARDHLLTPNRLPLAKTAMQVLYGCHLVNLWMKVCGCMLQQDCACAAGGCQAPMYRTCGSQCHLPA